MRAEFPMHLCLRSPFGWEGYLLKSIRLIFNLLERLNARMNIKPINGLTISAQEIPHQVRDDNKHNKHKVFYCMDLWGNLVTEHTANVFSVTRVPRVKSLVCRGC
jgi:hypothetical protein